MTKAIFFKELIKTRRVFWVSLLVAIIFAIYAIMCIRRVGTSHGVEHIWLIMLMKDQTFIDAIKYLPPVIGLAIGIAQMSPETQQKRLKLTLHLPYPQNKLIFTMICAGMVQCIFIFLIQAFIIGIYYYGVVTPEMASHVMLTTLPWYIAGLNAYLFTSAICLEGTWRRRIILSLIAIGVISVYYMQSVPQAYNGMIFGAVIFTILLILLSLYSVNRFKEGLID
ncbi:MAG: hypothetical protein HDS68_08385 [Bacteroidales bacterium]|nr:hypothetical protein [Bacteroidales bacterium]